MTLGHLTHLQTERMLDMDIEQALKTMNVSEELLTELYGLKEDRDAFEGVLVQHIEDMTACYELADDDWTQEMFISLTYCISIDVCYSTEITDLESFKKVLMEMTRFEFLVQIAHRLRDQNVAHMKDPECDKAIDMTLNAASFACEYFDDMFDDVVFKNFATYFMIGYLNACVFETGKV